MPLGATELIIIAVVVILLFGAKKMPQMARSLGQSMRIIKAETKGMREDDDGKGGAVPTADTPAATPAQQLPAAGQAAQAEKTPEQLKAEVDELKRKLAAQEQAQKNAS
ncbi:Sec-independent protein translocase subunit TatA [Actinokineospora pegani]|uniref:Sec-independent protein translocase subunit TatA n=1 Tax=Actinokineospora pegani TaxID=2654637 RepID=UPI0012EAFE58|nr:Sec-independent protein translocase subunit TatA [Actinokineospora pegani]